MKKEKNEGKKDKVSKKKKKKKKKPLCLRMFCRFSCSSSVIRTHTKICFGSRGKQILLPLIPHLEKYLGGPARTLLSPQCPPPFLLAL